MTRDEALTAIDRQLGLNSKRLLGYANEINMGGNDNGKGTWLEGPSWEVEGQILYALVRALKPKRILEIGTNHGGSTTYMAQACAHNLSGHVTTVDIRPQAGYHIPPHLRDWVTVECEDANLFVARSETRDYDFIFEDGNHSKYQVHVVYQNVHTLLKPGGVIISHDAAVEGVKDYIRYGIEAAGFEYPPMYVVEPSPCGFTVMQRNEF